MQHEPTFIQPAFNIGPIVITSTVVTTWAIMGILLALAIVISRRLRLEPNKWQIAVEGVIIAIRDAIAAVAPQDTKRIMPFIATLWIYILLANLCGLIPGVHSPTRDLSATAALAILVFFGTHWFGIRIEGLKNYLAHYFRPSPILFPFHIISEITRSIALAVRLFGNIMSLEMAAMLILLVAGFLAPVPILMLHIIEALVQAYIFGMLALIYVAGGIQYQHIRQKKKE